MQHFAQDGTVRDGLPEEVEADWKWEVKFDNCFFIHKHILLTIHLTLPIGMKYIGMHEISYHSKRMKIKLIRLGKKICGGLWIILFVACFMVSSW